MGVPLIKPDLPPLEALESQFREVLASGRVTNFGRYVQQFERDAGVYLGTSTATLSSATAGLLLTLEALEVPRGSRIAIPSFSFVATAQAVYQAGCIPVFIDVGDDGNADPADLERLLETTPDVHAVILVHMYGLACDAPVFEAIVRRAEARAGHRIRLLFDAAHAFGSSRGVRVGGGGDAEVFSTSVTKVLTSVEGGIVSSRDTRLIERVKKLRNYGIAANYDAHFPGLNGKMSELHALVGLYNLARLDALLEARAERAATYAAELGRLATVRVMTGPAGAVHTYKDFTVQLDPALKPERTAIIDALAGQGIETRAYFFPPIHEQQFFRPFADRPLPATEDLSRRVITLPFFTTITDAEIRTVVAGLGDAIRAAAGRASGAGVLS
jgi:dTDP-4-amino-4,6-dideoxygalactose transaminase